MTKSNIPDELVDFDQLGASPLIEGLYVPKEVWIEDEYLVAHTGFHYSKSVDLNVKLAEAMLSEFLSLGASSDDIIKRYALEWGLLGLCEQHGVPFSHSEGCYWKKKSTIYTPSYPETVYEPLDGWRSMARQALAIMNIAKRLAFDELGDPKDWATLKEGDVLNNFSWWEMADSFPAIRPDGKGLTTNLTKLQRVRRQQSRLALVLSQWLQMAGTVPRLRSWAGRTYLYLMPEKASAPLFNALVVQIVFYIHGTSGFALCANCGRITGLRKGQNLSRRVYCINCGKKAVNRDAAKRYRVQEREHPNRKKSGPKLKPNQIESFERQIKKARKTGESLRPLISKLAVNYKVSESTLYKIAKKMY